MRHYAITGLLLVAIVSFFAVCEGASVDVRSLKKNGGITTSKSRPLSIPRKKSNFRRPTSPLSAFCQDLVAQCEHIALNGRTRGHVLIQYVCRQNGGAFSPIYTFKCLVNGADLTKQVMNALGSGITYQTTATSFTTVSTTATVVTTATASTIASTVTGTSTTTTATTATTTTETPTSTVSTTVDVTVASLATFTTVSTATSTITTPTTITQTQTSTTVVLGAQTVNVVQVSISSPSPTAARRDLEIGVRVIRSIPTVLSPDIEKRWVKVDHTPFCDGFSSACTSQCSNARSSVALAYCHASGSSFYALSCLCSNGRSLTNAALLAAAQKQYISTVSTIQTQTATLTATSTATITQTISSTSTQTSVLTVPTTLTFTSTTTDTLSLSYTDTYTTPTTVSTESQSTTVTATVFAPTETVTATLTSKLVLAPTGYIGAFSPDGSVSHGIAQLSSQVSMGQIGVLSTTADDPAPASGIQFMAVRDAASGLYQLQTTDGSQNVLIATLAYQSTADFEPASYTATYLQIDGPNVCGAASSGAVPPAGADSFSGNVCETFIFSAVQDQLSLSQNASAANLRLAATWQNPSGSASSSFNPTLGLEDYYALLGMTSNVTAFDAFYQDNMAPIMIRFPIVE